MIRRNKMNYIWAVAFAFAQISCGGGGGNDDPGPGPTVDPPTAATLELPENNEVCLTGVSVNDQQSRVSFSWLPGQNTSQYQVTVKNLNTDVSNTYNSNTANLDITLTKGEPYSWYVVSKSSQTTQTAQSSIWKFYLAGNGIVSYAPFPATLVAPASGTSVTATGGVVHLEWQGADVEDDIVGYDVFMDQVDGNTTRLATLHPDTKLENVSVNGGTVYYWQVISIDLNGNSSSSGIFSFKVN